MKKKGIKIKNGGKIRLSDQEIHVHVPDDLLPVPTVLDVGVHDLPHAVHYLEGRLDVAEIGVGFQRLESLADAVALFR